MVDADGSEVMKLFLVEYGIKGEASKIDDIRFNGASLKNYTIAVSGAAGWANYTEEEYSYEYSWGGSYGSMDGAAAMYGSDHYGTDPGSDHYGSDHHGSDIPSGGHYGSDIPLGSPSP